MRGEFMAMAAVLLDVVLGDPPWLPHPVRGIGCVAAGLEPRIRKACGSGRLVGLLAWALIVGPAGAMAWGIWQGFAWLHPVLGDLAGIWIVYTTLAARDMARHSSAVHRELETGNLPEARKKLSWIVGRDTVRMDEPEIVRATVETVAEGTMDGVTAPLFFAMLLGPAGAMAYRAVNTLDSMWGHKDERYLSFGWASARLDDLANWIPARLTGLMMSLTAGCLRLNGRRAWKTVLRDARQHPSPNSGFPEAAMAGAFGVQLGGTNYYDGEPETRPFLGDPIMAMEAFHIPLANRLMFATVWLFASVEFLIVYLSKG